MHSAHSEAMSPWLPSSVVFGPPEGTLANQQQLQGCERTEQGNLRGATIGPVSK